MARHVTMLAGVISAFGFLLIAAASNPAAAYIAKCDYVDNLPCVASGNDLEANVENALESVFGHFVDVMMVDKVDIDTNIWHGQGISGSNGLTVSAHQFKTETSCGYWCWPAPTVTKKEGIAGTFKYQGPETIAYVTIKAGNSFAIYSYSDLVSGNIGSWNTSLLGNKGLSHLSIWKVVSARVSEPGTLGLLLAGITFLAWRRSRGAPATA